MTGVQTCALPICSDEGGPWEMKIRRFSEEHIVGILKEHEAGSWGRHPGGNRHVPILELVLSDAPSLGN